LSSLAFLRGGRVRQLLASAAVLGAVALSGCQTDGIDMAKALKPLSPEMVSLLEKKRMAKDTPILVRLYKEESELEVWKKDNSGQYALLKTYPICRWSGELGPKIREGDRQAPEGFYTITPGQMNPKSAYYLSFNLGYPNAFDRAHGRTGAHLMVHGDCSSRGCYSMTDEQIAEIYALGREAFFGGQKSFQVQAYPFRMTALNLAKHRNSPHLSFWKMLKQGSDHFELARQEPKVDVCEKRYVFNATTSSGFRPTEQCPAYEVDRAIASAVDAKTRRDELAFADLSKSTPTLPVKTGRDGGMHEVFVAKLNPQIVRDDSGGARWLVEPKAPGTIPDHVSPPREPELALAGPAASSPLVARVPMPRPAPGQTSRFAAAQPATRGVDPGVTYTASPASKPAPSAAEPNAIERAAGSVARMFGFASEPATPAPKPVVAQRPAPRAVETARATPRPAAPNQPPKAQFARADGSRQSSEAAPSSNSPPPAPTLVSGARPALPSGSFESRWQSFR
jgi:murein L,D-transpeptidase YafK